MTLNDRILDFLDGSLPADDEAELMHTLSVSPEKRGVLRGFMDQRSLLSRDAKSLSVPYEAEQRLWARMDGVLPANVAEETTTALIPVEAPSSGFFARTLSGVTSSGFKASSLIHAAISAFTLVAGIGIGYFAGHSQSVAIPISKVSPIASSQFSANVDIATPHPSYGTHASHGTHGISAQQGLPLLAVLPPPQAEAQSVSAIPATAAFPQTDAPAIQPVSVADAPAIALANSRSADIGGDGFGNRPILHGTSSETEASPSFLSRFEFRIDESFGRQFPSSAETNVSLPIITNSSITTFFQVLPQSNLLWAGASYGSANITRKSLFAQPGDPTDPLQQALASDTIHSQTSYIAALAELRLPAFAAADVTFTGGYGLATLGQMMFGEIGLHYNMSSQAGIQCGLRVLRFTYNLRAEEASVISSGTSSFAISNPVAASGPSFNTELNMGLFFHF